ncbi:hypothetical protein [Lacticaseibacillus kribbianus]|uniref:hypothetical protein n=1 Tax=Lacticaseibacillus kribbianus TaxID=2926292 RepID=UPI001CD4D9AA|nr:hypothetical protein [Lacticaseibacillus kribbianus]
MKSIQRAWRMALLVAALVAVAIVTRPRPVRAATAPLQSAVVATGKAGHYRLVLRNTQNATYRDVTVVATLPKKLAKQSGKLTWHIAQFGLGGEQALPFTVDAKTHKVATTKAGASVAYSRRGPSVTVIALGAVGVVALLGGGFWMLQRRRGAAVLLLIGTLGGGLALWQAQPAQAADADKGAAEFTLNGTVYRLKTRVTYTKVGGGLTAFSARLGQVTGPVTITDAKTKAARQVALRDHVLTTRLVASHRYTLKAPGLKATLTPGGRNGYTVQAATGKVKLGTAITKPAGELVLQSTAQTLPAGAAYRIDPAHARITVAAAAGDYRVGDTLYVPPFGYNYGGAVARVTAVSQNGDRTVLTVTDAPVDRVLASVDAPGATANMRDAVFIPAAAVAVSGTPAKGIALTNTGWSATLDVDVAYKLDDAKHHRLTYQYPKVKDASNPVSIKNDLAATGGVTASYHYDFLTHRYKASIDEDMKLANSFAYTLSADADTSAKLAKLKTGLPLGEIVVPTPAPGVTVAIPVSLNIEASGKIKATFDLGISEEAHLTAASGKKLKLTHAFSAEGSGKLDLSATARAGLNAKTKLVIASALSPVDVSAFAGLQVDADASFGFKLDAVTPAASARADASIEGDFVAELKGESELPKLWGQAPLATAAITYNQELFSWHASTDDQAKKKATKKKAAKKKPDAASTAAALDAALKGKTIRIEPDKFDGVDASQAMDQNLAPQNLVHDFSPYGYFLSGSEVRITNPGNYFAVITAKVTAAGGKLSFEDAVGTTWNVPYTLTGDQITLQPWTGPFQDGHQVTWQPTLGADLATMKAELDGKPMQR